MNTYKTQAVKENLAGGLAIAFSTVPGWIAAQNTKKLIATYQHMNEQVTFSDYSNIILPVLAVGFLGVFAYRSFKDAKHLHRLANANGKSQLEQKIKSEDK